MARNAVAAATSSIVPARLSGIVGADLLEERLLLRRSSGDMRSTSATNCGVMTIAGATTLKRGSRTARTRGPSQW